MAKVENITGLAKSNQARKHFDIYAIIESSQEVYFGDEKQVNVNLTEQVRLQTPAGQEIRKCYLSPTKRRGVERRSLIFAPTSSNELLGDKQQCGIPKACAEEDCPICSIFGALRLDEKKTFIGRLTHGGGVAIQSLAPEEKQRAMHPAVLRKEKGSNNSKESPAPFRKEYQEPGLLYPITNHALSITETEFEAAAYAFLDSLARLGAGNPKGLNLFQDGKKLCLVVDSYTSPLGKRPVISPSETNAEKALSFFWEQTFWVHGKQEQKASTTISKNKRFTRYIGDDALIYLQECADNFVSGKLQG